MEHRVIQGKENLNEFYRDRNLLLVFPVKAKHYFPTKSYRQSVPSRNGRQLCDNCFTIHAPEKDGCSYVKCVICDNARCINRKSMQLIHSYDSGQLSEPKFPCQKCEYVFWTSQCLDAHQPICAFKLCKYCNTYYDDTNRKAKCEHFVFFCNVSICGYCGKNFR